MSKRILCLETATKSCSVALFENEKLVAFQEESADRYLHSEKLTLFISSVLQEANCKSRDLDALALGKGPGSYTGLRIGVSVAKGLCYGSQTPLISMHSTRALFEQALQKHPQCDFYIPMIDARRMEAYVEIFDASGQVIDSVHSKELEPDSFSEYAAKKVLVCGDAAKKFSEISACDFQFENKMESSAKFMGKHALEKFEKEEFEDVAYFEPFYLKEFIAGKPKQIFK